MKRAKGVPSTLDESLLLVSTLSAAGTDQVLIIELATGRTGVFSRVIGQNRNGVGLHRARNANVFAWATSSGRAGSTGSRPRGAASAPQWVRR